MYTGLEEKEPNPDLVPIKIELGNKGTVGARKIHVFLEFPLDCELFSERDAKGGLLTRLRSMDSSGLYVGEKANVAHGILEYLGNDLSFSFSPIYVRARFRDESEAFL